MPSICVGSKTLGQWVWVSSGEGWERASGVWTNSCPAPCPFPSCLPRTISTANTECPSTSPTKLGSGTGTRTVGKLWLVTPRWLGSPHSTTGERPVQRHACRRQSWRPGNPQASWVVDWGPSTRVAGPIRAPRLGNDLSLVPSQAMNKTGLIPDSTMHWIGQGHAMIGEGTSEALGVAGNAVFGGKEGRAQSAAIVGRYAKNAMAFNPETDPWRHVRLNNPGSWVAGAYLAAGDGFSRIFGMGTAHDQLSQEAQEQRDNYVRGISGALFHAPGKDFKGTLSQLAAAHGMTVDQKTLDQMAAVAERMPGANVKQILERSEEHTS